MIDYKLILLLVLTLYVIIQMLKSLTVGPSFSILKWIIHKSDYTLWYKNRQRYIPLNKRKNFAKNTN